jgi:hypothetical protein
MEQRLRERRFAGATVPDQSHSTDAIWGELRHAGSSVIGATSLELDRERARHESIGFGPV